MSIRMIFPNIYGKKRNVPKHQPIYDIVWTTKNPPWDSKPGTGDPSGEAPTAGDVLPHATSHVFQEGATAIVRGESAIPEGSYVIFFFFWEETYGNMG